MDDWAGFGQQRGAWGELTDCGKRKKLGWGLVEGEGDGAVVLWWRRFVVSDRALAHGGGGDIN